MLLATLFELHRFATWDSGDSEHHVLSCLVCENLLKRVVNELAPKFSDVGIALKFCRTVVRFRREKAMRHFVELVCKIDLEDRKIE